MRWFEAADGTSHPDFSGNSRKLGGRGVYTVPDIGAVTHAAKTRRLKGGAELLLNRFREAGEARFFQRLGLALRAGALHPGQRALEDARATTGLVILALDASRGTRRKYLTGAVVRELPVLVLRSGASFGVALGREFVSVAAVEPGRFADDLMRLASALAEESGEIVSLDDLAAAKFRLEQLRDTR